MPKVSIICTVKNGGELFKDTLESVVHQSYEDWELIIVDDGSNDNTLDTVKEFAKKIIKYNCFLQRESEEERL